MSYVATQPISQAARQQEAALARLAIGFSAWAEKWFPDGFVFVAIAVVIVALAAHGLRRRAGGSHADGSSGQGSRYPNSQGCIVSY